MALVHANASSAPSLWFAVCDPSGRLLPETKGADAETAVQLFNRQIGLPWRDCEIAGYEVLELTQTPPALN